MIFLKRLLLISKDQSRPFKRTKDYIIIGWLVVGDIETCRITVLHGAKRE